MSEFTPDFRFVRPNNENPETLTPHVCTICSQTIEGNYIEAGPVDVIGVDCAKGIEKALRRARRGTDDETEDDQLGGDVEVIKMNPIVMGPCICKFGLTADRTDPAAKVCTECKGTYQLDVRRKAELLSQIGAEDPTPAKEELSFRPTETAAMRKLRDEEANREALKKLADERAAAKKADKQPVKA